MRCKKRERERGWGWSGVWGCGGGRGRAGGKEEQTLRQTNNKILKAASKQIIRDKKLYN